jgi:hypothetical protein
MDLSQQKLTKEEWDALEVPIHQEEKVILKMIIDGFTDVNIVENETMSIMNYMKIYENEDFYMDWLFKQYFKETVDKYCKKYDYEFTYTPFVRKLKKIKSSEQIRLRNFDKKLADNKLFIFEYILLDFIKKISKKNDKHSFYFYTMTRILNTKIKLLNKHILLFCTNVLSKHITNISRKNLIKKSYDFIEKNKYLTKYEDKQLYLHQKNLFSAVKTQQSKLVLYQAPTGTGKTLSPIGISKHKKIVFVCAAKHVGMQLAKSCISMGIPIAIAFGCLDAGDIRLHYYAAKDFVKNRRTGGIFRVDNSVGDKVEIIISDIKSYLCSMNYMLAFNKPEDLVWFWDEPTITLDYTEHPFHEILKNNWNQNRIPNVILSSATLPKQNEIYSCISSFRSKFPMSTVQEITSYECKKTIPILDEKGYVVLPHLIFENYDELKSSISYLNKNKTILRHFDLGEITKFILYINKKGYLKERYSVNTYFEDIGDINVIKLKEYYILLLSKIKKNYNEIYEHFQEKKQPLHKSVVKITTEDAHTLTDGPTIYLTNDVDKIGKFYLKVTNIKEDELDKLNNIIDINNEIQKQIDELMKTEKERTDKLAASLGDKAMERVGRDTKEYQLQQDYKKNLSKLLVQIKKIELNPEYIPNSDSHLRKFVSKSKESKAFTSNVRDDIVEKIIQLKIENNYKILLLMGIGVFKNDVENVSHTNSKEENERIKAYRDYIAIMKELALQQNLYLIVASSDYIYGTNYNFCHGYISKDLQNITKEKLIQGLGRVGRKNNKLDYSIRLRSNNLIRKLLLDEDVKQEVVNMNRLFQ